MVDCPPIYPGICLHCIKKTTTKKHQIKKKKKRKERIIIKEAPARERAAPRWLGAGKAKQSKAGAAATAAVTATATLAHDLSLDQLGEGWGPPNYLKSKSWQLRTESWGGRGGQGVSSYSDQGWEEAERPLGTDSLAEPGCALKPGAARDARCRFGVRREPDVQPQISYLKEKSRVGAKRLVQAPVPAPAGTVPGTTPSPGGHPEELPAS